ncbi:MAG: hypothetical protein A3H91_17485 [Gammaproteobacteria bacterium RIFCSPLOWO2_02_FULL_61_13]|nr:MAG: hypothetical protein A3H91_17485 [Gammaproteobacteria bacterium RIFCSPLOWO2_02_FULL_61_13]
MSTSLKLPEKLKSRIAKVARGSGQSAHAFMVGAIERQTAAAEKQQSFIKEALAARVDLDKTGLAYDWTEVREYHRARLQGRPATRPKLKPWRE